MSGRVLVAGVGNIFRGDDGYGSIAARELVCLPWPQGVRVVDYGISGMHLAFDLLDGYDVLILLDAAVRGGTPGDLVVLEVDPDDVGSGFGIVGPDPHGMDPGSVLAGLDALGGRLPRTFVVACEPADVGEGMGLSPPAAAAVDRTAGVVADLLRDHLKPNDLPEPGRRNTSSQRVRTRDLNVHDIKERAE